MQARVQKWGNSLAIRIPKSLATQSHLDQNSFVEMSVEIGEMLARLYIWATEINLQTDWRRKPRQLCLQNPNKFADLIQSI